MSVLSGEQGLCKEVLLSEEPETVEEYVVWTKE